MEKITIKNLWHSIDENEWKNALEQYFVYMASIPELIDIEIDVMSQTEESISKMTSEEWYELLCAYMKWKFDKHYLGNRIVGLSNDTALDAKKDELLHCDKENIEQMISILIKINELGVKSASGLLALLFPKLYGTVDKFTIIALQKLEEYPKLELVDPDFSGSKFLELAIYIIEIYRSKAKQLNVEFKTDFWNPRKIEIILWIYGHDGLNMGKKEFVDYDCRYFEPAFDEYDSQSCRLYHTFNCCGCHIRKNRLKAMYKY
jgi:hypothetical protein